MAIDILGNRVDDDIGAVVQRVLNIWAQEGVVHYNHDPMLVCDRRHFPDINQPQGRVRRTLDPYQFGLVGPDQIFHVELNARSESDLDAMRRGDLGEVPVCATIDV